MRAVFSSFLSPSPPTILGSLPKSALPLKYTTPTLTAMVQYVWISFETNGTLRWQSQRVGNWSDCLWWPLILSISLALHLFDIARSPCWWSIGAAHCASIQDRSCSLRSHGKGMDEEVSHCLNIYFSRWGSTPYAQICYVEDLTYVSLHLPLGVWIELVYFL